MSDVKPVRLQLKRTRGFNLQQLSLETNGLPAVKVCRPGPFGNPWTVKDAAEIFEANQERAHREAVKWFKDWLFCDNDELFGPMHCYGDTKEARDLILARLDELRGKNLACFCKRQFDCHADVLLELSNQPSSGSDNREKVAG